MYFTCLYFQIFSKVHRCVSYTRGVCYFITRECKPYTQVCIFGAGHMTVCWIPYRCASILKYTLLWLHPYTGRNFPKSTRACLAEFLELQTS